MVLIIVILYMGPNPLRAMKAPTLLDCGSLTLESLILELFGSTQASETFKTNLSSSSEGTELCGVRLCRVWGSEIQGSEVRDGDISEVSRIVVTKIAHFWILELSSHDLHATC